MMNYGNGVGGNAWPWSSWSLPSHSVYSSVPAPYPLIVSHSSVNWSPNSPYYNYAGVVPGVYYPLGGGGYPRPYASASGTGPDLHANSVGPTTSDPPLSDASRPADTLFGCDGREHRPVVTSAASDTLPSGSAFNYAGDFGSCFPFYPPSGWENRHSEVDAAGFGHGKQPRKEELGRDTLFSKGNAGASLYPTQLNLGAECSNEGWNKYTEETAFPYSGLNKYYDWEINAGIFPAKGGSYPEPYQVQPTAMNQNSSFFSYEARSSAPGPTYHHESNPAAVAHKIPNNLPTYQTSHGLPVNADNPVDSSFTGLIPKTVPFSNDVNRSSPATDPTMGQGSISHMPDVTPFLSAKPNEVVNSLHRTSAGCASNAPKKDSGGLDNSVGFSDMNGSDAKHINDGESTDTVLHKTFESGVVEKVLDSPVSWDNMAYPNLMVKMGAQAAIRKMLELSELLLSHSSIGYLLDNEDIEFLEVIKENFNLCMATNIHREIMEPGPEKLERQPSIEDETSNHSYTINETANVPIQPDSRHMDQEKGDTCGSDMKSRELIASLFSDDLSEPINVDMAEKVNKTAESQFQCDEELSPKALVFRNLWLDAEAQLYAIGYEARFNKMMEQLEAMKLRGNENKIVSEEGCEVMPSISSKDGFGDIGIDMADKIVPHHQALSETDERGSTLKYGCSGEDEKYELTRQCMKFSVEEEDEDEYEDEDEEEEEEEDEEYEDDDDEFESGCESGNESSGSRMWMRTCEINDEGWEHIVKDDDLSCMLD